MRKRKENKVFLRPSQSFSIREEDIIDAVAMLTAKLNLVSPKTLFNSYDGLSGDLTLDIEALMISYLTNFHKRSAINKELKRDSKRNLFHNRQKY